METFNLAVWQPVCLCAPLLRPHRDQRL